MTPACVRIWLGVVIFEVISCLLFTSYLPPQGTYLLGCGMLGDAGDMVIFGDSLIGDMSIQSQEPVMWRNDIV